MRKGIVLLPLILFVMLGAFVLILSTKFENKTHAIKMLNTRNAWLDLHCISVKEHIKTLLKNKSIAPLDFTIITLTIGDYHYTAVLKAFNPTLTSNATRVNPQPIVYYFVDVWGIYRDSSKEFLQEFSTRRSFILSLQESFI